jgi:GNAT superfamily N-acetyltransferase
LDNDAVELRDATSDDVDACLVVQRRSAVVGYAHIFAQDLYPFPDDVVRAEWVRRLASDARVVVASESGELIGTISARPPWVEALFVVPQAWGTGVAGQLLDRADGFTSGVAGLPMGAWSSRRFRRTRICSATAWNSPAEDTDRAPPTYAD